MKRILILLVLLLAVSSQSYAMGALTDWILSPSQQYIVYGGARYNAADNNSGLTLNFGLRTPFPGVESTKLCLFHNIEAGGGYANMTEQAALLFKLPTEILPNFLKSRPIYLGPILGAGTDITSIPEDPTWYLLYSVGGIVAFDLSDYFGAAGFFTYKTAFDDSSQYQNGNSAGVVLYLRLPNI